MKRFKKSLTVVVAALVLAAVVCLSAACNADNLPDGESGGKAKIADAAKQLSSWYLMGGGDESYADIKDVPVDARSIMFAGIAKYFGVSGDYGAFITKAEAALAEMYPVQNDIDESRDDLSKATSIIWINLGLTLLGESPDNFAGRSFVLDYDIDFILSAQSDKGAWDFTWGDGAWGYDVDSTALTIEILSGLDAGSDFAKVNGAIDDGIVYINLSKSESGAYLAWGGESSSSTARVLSMAAAMGADIFKDERFLSANGESLVNVLIDTFKNDDGGYFANTESATDGSDIYSATDVIMALYNAHKSL